MTGDENIYTGNGPEKTIYTEDGFRSVIVPSPGQATYAAKSDDALIVSSALSSVPSWFASYTSANSEFVPVGAYPFMEASTPVALSFDGTVAAWGRTLDEPGAAAYFFDYRNPVLRRVSLTRYGYSMNGIAVSPNGHYAYISTNGGFIYAINLETGSDVTTMAPLTFQVSAFLSPHPIMVVSPDGLAVYAVGRRILYPGTPHPGGPTVLVKMTQFATIVNEVMVNEVTSSSLNCTISMSPDGTKVVVGDWDSKAIKCYAADSLTLLWSISWEKGVTAFSLDGDRLYAVHADADTLAVIDPVDGSTISTHTGGYGGGIAVGPRITHIYNQGLLVDRFAGEMIARNGATVGIKPVRVDVRYRGPNGNTREARATITGYRDPCLYHRNGYGGVATGLCAREISTGQWFTFRSADFGRTWESMGMVWDENFIYSDVSGTSDAIEIAAGIKKVGHMDSGSMVYVIELWFKYSTDGVSWSEAIKVNPYGIPARNGPVSIRQKVECGSSVIVVYNNNGYGGEDRWESKNLGKTWIKT